MFKQKRKRGLIRYSRVLPLVAALAIAAFVWVGRTRTFAQIPTASTMASWLITGVTLVRDGRSHRPPRDSSATWVETLCADQIM